jgi:hypothetical protein
VRIMGRLLVVLGLFSLATGSCVPAMADDIHLCNTAAQCNNNALTATSGTALYLYGNNSMGGDVYLAVLTPESDATDGFTARARRSRLQSRLASCYSVWA